MSETFTTNTVRANIRGLVARSGMTMKQFVPMSGMSYSGLTKFIRGDSDMSVGNVINIANGLGVHPGRLFDDIG